jgi:uncharacterized protein DUF4383
MTSLEAEMRRTALLFGAFLVLVGVAGLVPALSPHGALFGVFPVNDAHDMIHIASGLLAFPMAITVALARRYFRIAGAVYALATAAGFLAGHDGVLLGVSMNLADNALHLALAVVALVLGYARLTPPAPSLA